MPFPDEIAPVVLVQRSESWSTEYVALSRMLQQLDLSPSGAIDHIGSTSVPGLVAKDVIDVQIRVLDIESEKTINAFAAIGFRHRPEDWNNVEITRNGPEVKLVFAPRIGARRSNIHFRADGSTGSRDSLLFRDYLRTNEEARNGWGEFKMSIVRNVNDIDLATYGQIKQPRWHKLMEEADTWAAREGWSAESLVPWSRL